MVIMDYDVSRFVLSTVGRNLPVIREEELVIKDARRDSMVLTVIIHVVVSVLTVSSTEAVPDVNLVIMGFSVNRNVQTVRMETVTRMMDLVDKGVKMAIKETNA